MKPAIRRWATGFVLALSATAAAAEIITVDWSQGSQGGTYRLAPHEAFEVCATLRAGAATTWRYSASTELVFNVHFHEGDRVTYPVRKIAAEGDGRLDIAESRDYCWMWENRSSEAAELEWLVARPRIGQASSPDQP